MFVKAANSKPHPPQHNLSSCHPELDPESHSYGKSHRQRFRIKTRMVKELSLLSTVKQTLLYFIIFTLSFLLMHHTFKYQNGQFIIASKLFSDFGAHIPLIRSFSMGNNFPPEYPTFPGEPIRYHYLFYLLVGLLEKAGLNIAIALNLLSAFGFSLLLVMIFKYARLIHRSRLAGHLAVLLFLLNGSLSFIKFFRDHPLSPSTIKDITTATHFANFGPWNGDLVSAFWNLNIYTNQRHIGAGFGLALLLLWPLFKSLFSKHPVRQRTIIASIIGMVFLPLIHKAAFVSVLVVATTLILFAFKSKKLWPYYIVLLLSSYPGIARAISDSTAGITLQPGFLATSTSPKDLFIYWVFNLGFYLILIPILLLVLKKKHKIVILAFTPLFILANLFKFSPDMINNHKFINFFMIGVVITTSGLLAKLWQQHLAAKLFAMVLFITLSLSGILDLFPVINDYYLHVEDYHQSDVATWIHQSTSEHSIFLTTTYLYNPASLVGRKTFLDYGYFNWSLGYNDTARKNQLPDLFSPTNPMHQTCFLLHQNNIDYILIDAGNGDIPNVDPHLSSIATTSDPAFTSAKGHQIFTTKQICQNT